MMDATPSESLITGVQIVGFSLLFIFAIPEYGESNWYLPLLLSLLVTYLLNVLYWRVRGYTMQEVYFEDESA
jgi:hypothetical protein